MRAWRGRAVAVAGLLASGWITVAMSYPAFDRGGGVQVGTPSAMFSDVACAAERKRLADKTLHHTAIRKLDVADAERRADQVDKAAEVRERHLPDLERNRR